MHTCSTCTWSTATGCFSPATDDERCSSHHTNLLPRITSARTCIPCIARGPECELSASSVRARCLLGASLVRSRTHLDANSTRAQARAQCEMAPPAR